MFGVKGDGRARRIYSDSPYEESKRFFQSIIGAKVMPRMSLEELPNGKILSRSDVVLSDGSRVVWRSTTRDGTPAVSIKNKDQKLTELTEYHNIHFEKRN
jgi:hypothetical protein